MGELLVLLAPQLAHLVIHGARAELGTRYLRALAPFLPLLTMTTIIFPASRGYGTMRAAVDVQNLGMPILRVHRPRPDGHTRVRAALVAFAWAVPMLVIHGAQDFRVPLDQGIAAFTALQRRGIASEFLYFPDENHWVLKPQDVVRWHQEVEAWLKRWTAAP